MSILGHRYRHLRRLVVRYDNVGVSYAVDSTGFIDHTGPTAIISDIYKLAARNLDLFKKISFVKKLDDSVYLRAPRRRKWNRYITHRIQRTNSLVSVVDGNSRSLSYPGVDGGTTIHVAVCSGVDVKYIKMLLHDPAEANALRVQDSYGWNPLHYACAFPRAREGASTDNQFELVLTLLQYFPGLVEQRDSFGRFPLHLACETDVSHKVIQLLLEGKGSIAISKPTKYLKVRVTH